MLSRLREGGKCCWGGRFPSCSPLEPGEQSWDWQYDVEAVIVCEGFEI